MRLALVIALAVPVLAQAPSSWAQNSDGSSNNDLASAAAGAAETLTNSAKDKILIKDLLGTTIKGPDRQPVGTIENLVVIPGGRVIAAILATGDKAGRIPVPFAAVKLSRTAGQLDATLPVTLSKLQGMKEVQQLRSAVPGM